MFSATLAVRPTCLELWSSSEYSSQCTNTGHSCPRPFSSTDGIFFFALWPLLNHFSSANESVSRARPRYALPSTYPAFMRFASLLIFENHASSISRGPP